MNLMIGSSVVVAQFHLQYFLSSQITHNNILLHLLTRSPRINIRKVRLQESVSVKICRRQLHQTLFKVLKATGIFTGIFP